MSNNTLPSLHGLYAITDPQLSPGETLFQHVEACVSAGTQWLQYRDKETSFDRKLAIAAKLHTICQRHQSQLIINDDLALAKELGAHIHLGQEDSPIDEARRVLGKETVIGATCHNSLDLAEQAVKAGASYLAFGAMFTSPTKPNAIPADLGILQEAKAAFGLPVVAIGGISLDNAAQVIDHGADMIAVISAIFASDNIQQRCRAFHRLFAQS